jgi:CMP-N-acetylneuraminic acid synthetase
MAGTDRHIVALLPLKAHSSRVPRKNFRIFHGKPLVRWVLDALLAIDRIDLVVINTDARAELREVGVVESGRVLIRDRRADLCGDDVSMNLVLADDVAAVRADLYLMTHTTNPLLTARTIDAALAAFEAGRGAHDSLFTVNRMQTRFYRADGSPVNHDPARLIPTQELEPWFEENSNLYLFTADSFRSTGARIGRRPILFEMSRIEAADIDTQADWDQAEALARGLYPHGPPA